MDNEDKNTPKTGEQNAAPVNPEQTNLNPNPEETNLNPNPEEINLNPNPEETNPNPESNQNANPDANPTPGTSFMREIYHSENVNPGTSNAGATNVRVSNVEQLNVGVANASAPNLGVSDVATDNVGATFADAANVRADNVAVSNAAAVNAVAAIAGASDADSANTTVTNVDTVNEIAATTGASIPVAVNEGAGTVATTNLNASHNKTSHAVVFNAGATNTVASTPHPDSAPPPKRKSSLKVTSITNPNDLPQKPAKEPAKDSDSDSSEEEHNVEYDADLLESVLYYLGEFGTYQKFLFVAMIPFSLFYAWVYFSPMFVMLTPEPYWCYVPELAHLTKEERYKLTGPGSTKGEWDGCKVYVTDWSQVLATNKPPPPNTPKKPCTSGFEYDYTKEVPYVTIVSERDWVCDKATNVPTAQSIFFAGSVVGGFVFGWLADSYGRLPALMAVNIVGGMGGIGSTFSRGVWDLYVCRFFGGMSYDNCIMIAYILVLEYVGPSRRSIVATLPMALYYGTGAVALPWIAYYLSNWRTYVWVTASPMFIVLIAPWTLPESARWLVSKGRIDEAVKILRSFERVNKAKVPKEVMDTFIETSKTLTEEKKEVFSNLFKSSDLRKVAAFMMLTFCISECVYDVIVRLCESFGLDFFLTFTINAAAEIPSVLVAAALLDKLGRRTLVWGPMFISAVCALIAVFVPKGLLEVLFALVSRFCINLAFTVTLQWVTEILPTPFRATGSAILHMTGFAFCCLSPFIVYSGTVMESLPLLCICAMSLTAGMFSLTLPETKGLELPQTVADAEIIINEYSLFRKPEVKILKRTIHKLAKNTITEPVRRSSQGRVSLILSGSSKTVHSKLSHLDVHKV